MVEQGKLSIPPSDEKHFEKGKRQRELPQKKERSRVNEVTWRGLLMCFTQANFLCIYTRKNKWMKYKNLKRQLSFSVIKSYQTKIVFEGEYCL